MSTDDDNRTPEWFDSADAFDGACNELRAIMDLLTLLEDAASQPREGTLITMGLRGLECLERMEHLYRELLRSRSG